MTRLALARGEIVAALFLLGALNGLAVAAANLVVREGLATAALRGFDIGVLVWIGCVVAVVLSLRDASPATGRDVAIAAAALAAFATPVPHASWLALTGVCAYLLLGTAARQPTRRAAAVMLATTLPAFWADVALALAPNALLNLDAAAAAALAGAARVGNTLAMSDGAGWVWLAPACSSLPGVAAAVLCWTLFVQAATPARIGPAALVRLIAACVAVATINAARIALLAALPDRFALAHGPLGATLASWAMLLVSIAICAGLAPRGSAHAPSPTRA